MRQKNENTKAKPSIIAIVESNDHPPAIIATRIVNGNPIRKDDFHSNKNKPSIRMITMICIIKPPFYIINVPLTQALYQIERVITMEFRLLFSLFYS